MKKRRFLYRLIAAYALIVLLYTAAATAMFFHKTNEMAAYRFASNGKEFLLQVRDKIDTQIRVALNAGQQMRLNEKIQRYIQGAEPDYYNVVKIQEELQAIANAFSNYGFVIGVQNLTGDHVITYLNTLQSAHFYEELRLTDDDIRRLEAFKRDEGRRNELLVFPKEAAALDDSKVFTLVKREQLRTGGELLVYMSFFEETVIPPLNGELAESFAIADRSGILSMKKSKAAADWRGFPDSPERLQAAPVEYKHEESAGYSVHTVGSLVLPGHYYIYMTPANALQEQTRAMLNDSLLLFGLLLLAGALLVLLVAANTYRPISRIVQANEALLEIAATGQLSMKHKFLRELLLGYVPEDRIEAGSRSYGLPVPDSPATVVILELADYHEWLERYSAESIRELKSELLVLIGRQLTALDCEVLEWDIMRYTVIVFGQDGERLERLLGRMTDTIQEGLDLGIKSVIGKPVERLGQLQESYRDALGLLEYRRTLSGKDVFTLADLGGLARHDYYYPLETEREIITCFVRGRGEQALTLVKQLVRENLLERRLPPEAVSQFALAIAGTVNRIFQQMKKPQQELFAPGAGLYTELLASRSPAEAGRKIEALFERMRHHFQELENGDEPSVADQLITYIQQNYDRDISLSDIADHFRMSSGYVSRLFKERTGSNFKDYLNLYRVRMAKRLMDERYIKLEELAQRVGCNNAITFSRMFKKYEGISPGQYGKRPEAGEG